VKDIVVILVLLPAFAFGNEASPTNLTDHASRITHQHWSFHAPERPVLPAIQNTAWPRNTIDTFIAARLEKENLKPAPEADRRTLIRRLSLDLLGLPPNPEEVAAFLEDERTGAYEELVDRLLSSPHFGERWARHWLDLARYADSDGYEKDGPRPYAYLYRDWVIEAINSDLPFDRFTIAQLAGDLLPGATMEQKIATGFHRNTLTNKEGGVDQEEFRCKATVDRVSTTSTVWLGLTVGCAECHTHKYDPIAHREFYQLYAFFNSASEKDLPSPQPAELAEYSSAKKQWDDDQAKLRSELASYLKTEIAGKQAQWEQNVQAIFTIRSSRREEALTSEESKASATSALAKGLADLAQQAQGAEARREHWIVLKPQTVRSAQGAELKVQDDLSIHVSGKNPPSDTYVIEVESTLQNITGFRLEILDDPAPGKGPGRGKSNNFVLSEFTVEAAPVATPEKASSERGAGAQSRRSDRAFTGAATDATFIKLGNASADHAPADWPVIGAIDGNPKTGWAINPQFDRRHVAVFETKENLTIPTGAKLVFHLDQQHGDQHTIGSFRLSATKAARPLKADLTPDSVAGILEISADRRSEKQKAELAKYYREEIDPAARKLDQRLAAHAKKEPKFPETKAQTMAESEKPRSTHIHIRGDFLRRGDEVQPGTPAVLHRLTARRERPDRLDLANWLVDPANPLTARVTVNRVWYHLFGRGLVTSMDDFGTRGEKPSHPELLDWLATEFPRLGWSRKALIKLIVTSATYRQSSAWRPELSERDPNNILLARQNRFRLEAEGVRDAYLRVSGLLNPSMGGPSIRPPLPADIAALGYANSVKWKESEGAERFRRGLYIFFQRTVPYPMLMTFDAPDSNVTCTRRERSNTPLQALTLLNDPVFFECAQALAKRMAAEKALGSKEKIKRGFALCLSREPNEEELARLEKLHVDYMRLAQGNPENAARLAGQSETSSSGVLEVASFVALGRTMLNLDEFLTRE
jgi:hypothetical protein